MSAGAGSFVAVRAVSAAGGTVAWTAAMVMGAPVEVSSGPESPLQATLKMVVDANIEMKMIIKRI